MDLEHIKTCVPKFLSLLDHGLTSGKGTPYPGMMCVEAAWCSALDLPHSDNPPCVGHAVRGAKIKLNDCDWSSNIARAEGLRAIGVAQMGSNQIDQLAFAKLLADAIPGLMERHPSKNGFRTMRLENSLELMKYYIDIDEAYTSYTVDVVRIISETADGRAADPDAVLRDFAGVMLSALKELNSPGCQWLDMIKTDPS